MLRYHQGDVYEGQFDHNLRSGKGIMQYRTGGEYVGDWQAGQVRSQLGSTWVTGRWDR